MSFLFGPWRTEWFPGHVSCFIFFFGAVSSCWTLRGGSIHSTSLTLEDMTIGPIGPIGPFQTKIMSCSFCIPYPSIDSKTCSISRLPNSTAQILTQTSKLISTLSMYRARPPGCVWKQGTTSTPFLEKASENLSMVWPLPLAPPFGKDYDLWNRDFTLW